MTTPEEVLSFGLNFPDTYQDTSSRGAIRQSVRVAGSRKAFLWISGEGGQVEISVRVNTEWRDFWRNAYESVVPGRHLNPNHWNTVILDGSIPGEEIRRMIAESYDLVTDSAAKRIYEAVRRVPKGKVATYAQIAAMAGNPRMCRAVGNALHKNPDPESIPCYRVVNSQGRLSGEFAFGGEHAQQRLLEADGIEVRNGKVDLEKYGIRL